MGSRAELTAVLARWRADRMAFRREAILLEDGRPFGEAMEPWQAEDFAALDDPQYRHSYIERARGHSKTFDMAVEAVDEMVLGPPEQRLFCVAADEDQARLLLDDVVAVFSRSLILKPLIRVTRTEVIVKATGTRLKVLNSNAPTLYGLRPDWIGADEIVEWRDRALWDSLWTATGKRPRCKVRIISTAGWDRTGIAWEVRQIAEREPDWYFSARGQCASWISPTWLEQQRRTLPAHVYARLHENRWVEAAGAYFTSAEVDGCFLPELPTGRGPEALGLDLGLKKDWCVLARVQHDLATGLVLVPGLWSWTPTPGHRVDLREVEEEVAALALRDRLTLVLDPWQGVLMSQQLSARRVAVVEYPFTSGSRAKLFSVLLDLIRTHRLRVCQNEDLRRQLLGLEVKETTTGWRVDHRPSQHDDLVMAVALAAQHVATVPVRTRPPGTALVFGRPADPIAALEWDRARYAWRKSQSAQAAPRPRVSDRELERYFADFGDDALSRWRRGEIPREEAERQYDAWRRNAAACAAGNTPLHPRRVGL